VRWGDLGESGLPNNDGPAELRGTISGIFPGYQHQYTSGWALGVEGNVEYNTIRGGDMQAGGEINGISVDFGASLRGRIGYSYRNMLPYVTAGYAYMQSDRYVGSSPTDSGNSDTDFSGWTIGSGVDYALGNGLFLRGEYRYSRFQEKVEVYDFYRLGFEPERHDWRIGLGYYF